MPVRAEYYSGATPSSPFYAATEASTVFGTDDRIQVRTLPAGWLVQQWSGWEGWTPRDWRPRIQGWKIHVSATPAAAEQTLTLTTDICVGHGVAFKFLPTRNELIYSSNKQGDRGGAGKFVTIYPDDDEQFATLVGELQSALAGRPGPYILSDLRVGDGPVYVRYGGILALEVPDPQDQPISSIARLDTLGLVPDVRSPRFVVPDGVEIPEVLQESYARSKASSSSRLKEFSTITPLHFSNAGGVYRATLPDGAVRVLREARPHAGLDARGRCAVERQRVEEGVLTDLLGVPGVQQLVGSFRAWEHRYLELDYVDGITLTAWTVRHIDLPDTDPVGYARRATHLGRQLIDVVERVHAHGWAVGDLHTGNVLVDDDDHLTLLDLEDATRLDDPREIGFRVMEFCGQEDLTAEQADWFAVARCLMMLYVPDWEIEAVAPTYWSTAVAKARARFGEEAFGQLVALQQRYPASARPVLASQVTVDVPAQTPTPDEVVDRLDRGLTWSQTYSTRSSYPGDVTQAGRCTHETLSSGRAGVVLARQRTGRPVAEADLDALTGVARSWAPGEGPGLYTGLAGLALVLSDAGRTDSAVATARTALEHSWARRRLDLAGGQAGTVLTALEVGRAAGDDGLVRDALTTYDRLHRTVVPDTSAWTSLTTRRGFLWGLTGLALTDLAAHLATDDPALLDRAVDRLRQEVDACVTLASGEVMVRDTTHNRVLPYVEWGSAGVWLLVSVAERLTGRPLLTDEERRGFALACNSELYIYPGLDHGRAGILATLTAAGPAYADQAARQSLLLRESLLEHDDALLCIGDGLIRLSSDLSTGAAGVALALHGHRTGTPFLPLPLARRTVDELGTRPVPTGPTPTLAPTDTTAPAAVVPAG